MKIKKYLYLFPLVFCLSNLFAQQESTLVGLRLGGNYSTFILRNQHKIFDYSDRFSSKQGFQVGVYTQQKLNKALAVKLEAYFIQKGVNVNNPPAGQANFYPLQYISIPVFLTYRKGHFEIETGLGISLLINGRKYFTNSQFSFANYLNHYQDICFHSGVLWHVSKLSIGLRYSRGLINLVGIQLRDNRGILLAKQPAFYNQSLQVSLAYSFK